MTITCNFSTVATTISGLSVSGVTIKALDKIFTLKDDKLAWTQEEDELLAKNSGILARWKGEEAVELRKRYLNTKRK